MFSVRMDLLLRHCKEYLQAESEKLKLFPLTAQRYESVFISVELSYSVEYISVVISLFTFL